MRCPSCKKKNMRKANYCKKCGRMFTEEEKKQAKKEGLDILLDAFKTVKDFLTLEFITDTFLFKFLSVLFIVAIGIYMLVTMGWNLRVVESRTYDVKYNQDIDTYYVFIEPTDEVQTKVDIKLYIPNRIQSMDLNYYDDADQLLSTENLSRNDRYTLNVNLEENNYYIIANHEKAEEKVKIYVYYGEEKNNETEEE